MCNNITVIKTVAKCHQRESTRGGTLPRNNNKI